MNYQVKTGVSFHQSRLKSGVQQQQELIKEIRNSDTFTLGDTSHVCNIVTPVFDELTGETICNHCGMVLSEKETILEEGIKSKERTCTPVSLVFPDKGRATFLLSTNTDANGVPLSHDQVNTINKIRYHDRRNNRAHTRTLKIGSSLWPQLKINLISQILQSKWRHTIIVKHFVKD
ncbi:MAG: hypothetical protein ACRD8W_01725 [Nitrososphaeraceae archaeon]